MYNRCLWLSAFSILWNTVCVILLRQGARIPVSVNIFMNSLYFIIIVLVCSVMAMYLFEKMLEHVYDDRCMKRAKTVVIGLFLFFCIFVLINPQTKLIFWFDEGGRYHRGVCNQLGYAIMMIETALLYYCYYLHRMSVSKVMRRILKMLLPVIIVLTGVQFIYPSLLLNGTLIAFADTLLFLNIQSQRTEEDSVTGVGNRDSFYSELILRLADSNFKSS